MSVLKRAAPLGAVIAAAVCWGSVVVTIKVAARGLPILTITAVEIAVTVVILAVTQGVRGKRLRLHSRGLRLAGVLEPGLAYPLINVGLQHTSGTHGAVIIGAESLFVVAGAAALDRARPRPRVVLAVALTVAGAAFLSGNDSGAASVSGDLLITAGVAVAAGYVLIAQRQPDPPDAVSSTLVQFTVGGITLLPILAVYAARSPTLGTLWGHPSPGETAAAVATGVIGSVVAFLLYNWSLPRVTAAVAATSLGLIPVFGITFSAIFLNDTITPAVLAAMAAVVTAVALTAGVTDANQTSAEHPAHDTSSS